MLHVKFIQFRKRKILKKYEAVVNNFMPLSLRIDEVDNSKKNTIYKKPQRINRTYQ